MYNFEAISLHSLTGCGIYEDEAQALADGLKHCAQLQSLNLQSLLNVKFNHDNMRGTSMKLC